MLKVTPAQYRVLSAIRSLSEQNGHVPTYREIGAVLGVNRGNVSKHIAALEKKGYISKVYGQPNSIELTIDGAH